MLKLLPNLHHLCVSGLFVEGEGVVAFVPLISTIRKIFSFIINIFITGIAPIIIKSMILMRAFFLPLRSLNQRLGHGGNSFGLNTIIALGKGAEFLNTSNFKRTFINRISAAFISFRELKPPSTV